MTQNTVPAAEPETPQRPLAAPSAPAEDAEGRFFTWLRDLGLVRHGGWLGGVCAAIAERTGIDPLIVRGIVVAVTVLGFPGLWLYALAWALLPDGSGRIPLQMRAGSAPALLGVAATFAVGLLALWLGNTLFEAILYSGSDGWFRSAIEAGLWLAALGAIAAVLILIFRRRSEHPLPHPGADGAVSGTAAVSGGVAFSVGSENRATPPPFLPEPPEPLATELATEADLETWRQQHAAWREQHEQWRRQQAGGEQAAYAEERARRAAERAAFRAEAARVRAERRASKPRTSVAFVAIAAGAALVAATIVWLAFQPEAPERALPAAVLAAAAVAGLAMVVAGILRRRSGFLAAVAAVLLVIGGSGSAPHLLRDLTAPDRYVPLSAGDQSISQPFGTLTLAVGDVYDDPGTISIEKGTGSVTILVYPGVDVEFRTTGDQGSVIVNHWSGNGMELLRDESVQARDGVFTWSHDDEDTTRTRTIVLDQQEVQVNIEVQRAER